MPMPIEYDSEEVWKVIPDTLGYYEASSHGRIRSVTRKVLAGHREITRNGKILTPRFSTNSRPHVCLYLGNGPEEHLVARLVYTAFKGPIPSGHLVYFIDDDWRNVSPSNLATAERLNFRMQHIERSRNESVRP